MRRLCKSCRKVLTQASGQCRREQWGMRRFWLEFTRRKVLIHVCMRWNPPWIARTSTYHLLISMPSVASADVHQREPPSTDRACAALPLRPSADRATGTERQPRSSRLQGGPRRSVKPSSIDRPVCAAATLRPSGPPSTDWPACAAASLSPSAERAASTEKPRLSTNQ